MNPSGYRSPMPRSLRRPQTVLSSLGMAGAVLASVVVTFAVASGLIAYNLTSSDPIPVSSSAALVLDLRAADSGDAPLVLSARHTSRAHDQRAATALRKSAAAADVRGLADGSLSASSRSRGASGGAGNTGSGDDPAPSPRPEPVRRPVGKALGDTTQAVGATTGSLGRRLETVTDALGPVVQQTGELVQAIAVRTSTTLDELLHKR